MAHPDHDAVVDAFQREAVRRGDPILRTCHRAGDAGYTHIHGPHQPCGTERCTTHAIVVEKFNGTVGLRAPFGQQLGGVLRPELPIAAHPLGQSAGPFGKEFTHGFDIHHILRTWSTLDAFASAVVAAFAAARKW